MNKLAVVLTVLFALSAVPAMGITIPSDENKPAVSKGIEAFVEGESCLLRIADLPEETNCSKCAIDEWVIGGEHLSLVYHRMYYGPLEEIKAAIVGNNRTVCADEGDRGFLWRKPLPVTGDRMEIKGENISINDNVFFVGKAGVTIEFNNKGIKFYEYYT